MGASMFLQTLSWQNCPSSHVTPLQSKERNPSNCEELKKNIVTATTPSKTARSINIPYAPRTRFILVYRSLFYGTTGRGFLSLRTGSSGERQSPFIQRLGCGQGAKSTPQRCSDVENPWNPSARRIGSIRYIRSNTKSAIAIPPTRKSTYISSLFILSLKGF